MLQLPGTQEYLENNTMWNYDAVGSPSAIFVPANEEELSTFLKFYANNRQQKTTTGAIERWGLRIKLITMG